MSAVISEWPAALSPHPKRCGLSSLMLGVLLLLFCRIVAAAPRIPPSEATVLEHVPAAIATEKLEPLRTRLGSHPQDLPAALALAQGYLDIGRATADPRFVSYAQATLAPWARAKPFGPRGPDVGGDLFAIPA